MTMLVDPATGQPSLRYSMQTTGKCPDCEHPAEQHHHNACHVLTDRSRCPCYRPGPDDFAAGDAWNSLLGR